MEGIDSGVLVYSDNHRGGESVLLCCAVVLKSRVPRPQKTSINRMLLIDGARGLMSSISVMGGRV